MEGFLISGEFLVEVCCRLVRRPTRVQRGVGNGYSYL